MENLITICYYTSNMEDPEFERKIQVNLKKQAKGIPIVSVSQKPIDLGKNIVVGDVGASGFNCFRQILIACKEAKTKFVLAAEADTLYPSSYFNFIPERDDICYRDNNLYVMGDQRNYFWRKPGGATHAQIVGRRFYIRVLEELFKGAPEWSVKEFNFPKERWHKSDVFDKKDIKFYRTEDPVVQIKTGDSLRYHTHSERIPIYDLPYWGNGDELRKKYITKKRTFK